LRSSVYEARTGDLEVCFSCDADGTFMKTSSVLIDPELPLLNGKITI
jgi:hypothetical protein